MCPALGFGAASLTAASLFRKQQWAESKLKA